MKTIHIVVLVTALIIILTASIIFILFFNNPQTPIQYKNYTKGDISFKYPIDWDEYLYDVNYGMTYSVDLETRKQNSTASMTKIADYSVAVGDPKTVGFKNNTVPTTMMVISNVTSKIDTYPKDYLAWKVIEGQINTTNNFQSDLSSNYKFISDLAWKVIEGHINTTNNFQSDSSSNYKFISDSTRNFTIGGEMAYECSFQGYTSYSGREYSKIVSFESRNSTHYTIYTIMCSARESQIENATRVFDEMIKSLRINY
jgi:hypothetical protein